MQELVSGPGWTRTTDRRIMSYVSGVPPCSAETVFRAWKCSVDISGDGFAPARVLPGGHPALPHSCFYAKGAATARRLRLRWSGVPNRIIRATAGGSLPRLGPDRHPPRSGHGCALILLLPASPAERRETHSRTFVLYAAWVTGSSVTSRSSNVKPASNARRSGQLSATRSRRRSCSLESSAGRSSRISKRRGETSLS